MVVVCCERVGGCDRVEVAFVEVADEVGRLCMEHEVVSIVLDYLGYISSRFIKVLTIVGARNHSIPLSSQAPCQRLAQWTTALVG